MEKYDAACLSDAKKEYTQRLVRKLKTPFTKKIFSILKEVKDECVNMHEDDQILIYFQSRLEKIPEWDDLTIQQFTSSVIAQARCDYMEELLQAVFIIHTKILLVIQHHNSNKKSELKLPSIENFVFQSFINVARELWKYAYLFKDTNNSCDFQQNNNTCEERVSKSIEETIEDMLPVRELLVEHVRDYIETENTDNDAINEKSKGMKGGFSMNPSSNRDTYFGDISNTMQSLSSIDRQSTTMPTEITPAPSSTEVVPGGILPFVPNVAPVPVPPPVPAPVNIPGAVSPTDPIFSTPAVVSPVTTPSFPPTVSSPVPVPVVPSTEQVPLNSIVPTTTLSHNPAPAPEPSVTGGSEIKTIDLDGLNASTVNLGSVSSNIDNPNKVSFDIPPPNLRGGSSMDDLESISYAEI
tara:strand:- start:16832 stop:18061 length:1230 start_codon:yes stop_codon:yes gene_type:complete